MLHSHTRNSQSWWSKLVWVPTAQYRHRHNSPLLEKHSKKQQEEELLKIYVLLFYIPLGRKQTDEFIVAQSYIRDNKNVGYTKRVGPLGFLDVFLQSFES